MNPAAIWINPPRSLLHELLRSICREQGTAFLIVTHNEELTAVSDRQLVLAAGALEARLQLNKHQDRRVHQTDYIFTYNQLKIPLLLN